MVEDKSENKHLDDYQENEKGNEGLENKNLNKEDNMQESGYEQHKVVHLSGMYKDWFLDYASYVILERAVPHINDGL